MSYAFAFQAARHHPRETLRISEGTSVNIGFSVDGLQFFIQAEKAGITRIQTPGSGVTTPAAIVGRIVRFDALEDRFPGTGEKDVRVSTSIYQGSGGRSVDEIELGVVITPQPPLEMDFSVIASSSETLTRPIVETFTIPSLNETAVWQILQNAYGLRDDEWDALAVYQNFDTDLIFWAAGSAGLGNPMVKGIDNGATFGNSLRPTMINVGHINRSASIQSPNAHLLLHEFGHRWLLFAEYDENGSRSKGLLDSAGAHPHAFVDTRAAYPVSGPNDYSAMGGGRIEQEGNTFRRLTLANRGAGYSWFDLYLIGLASPAEVSPLFYLKDAVSAGSDTWRATRMDVVLPQITTAMGPRLPAFPAAKRSFKVAVVLLVDPVRPPTAAQIALVKKYRAAFERDFESATGGRGSVSAKIFQSTRRRTVRH